MAETVTYHQEPTRMPQTSQLVPLARQLTPSFDYAELPPEYAEFARSIATRFRNWANSSTVEGMKIGLSLIEIKSRLDHGQFGTWLRAEFPGHERTAQRLMQTAKVFGDKYDTVSDLPPATLYELSAPSTPAELRVEVIEHLEAGSQIDPVGIRARIQEARKSLKRSKAQKQAIKRRESAKPAEQSDRNAEARFVQELQRAIQAAEILLERIGDELPDLLDFLKDGRWNVLHLLEWKVTGRRPSSLDPERSFGPSWGPERVRLVENFARRFDLAETPPSRPATERIELSDLAEQSHEAIIEAPALSKPDPAGRDALHHTPSQPAARPPNRLHPRNAL